MKKKSVAEVVPDTALASAGSTIPVSTLMSLLNGDYISGQSRVKFRRCFRKEEGVRVQERVEVRVVRVRHVMSPRHTAGGSASRGGVRTAADNEPLETSSAPPASPPKLR